MWDLPRPGLEPVSPALAGRFSTTAPPGKPTSSIFAIKDNFLIIVNVVPFIKIIFYCPVYAYNTVQIMYCRVIKKTGFRVKFMDSTPVFTNFVTQYKLPVYPSLCSLFFFFFLSFFFLLFSFLPFFLVSFVFPSLFSCLLLFSSLGFLTYKLILVLRDNKDVFISMENSYVREGKLKNKVSRN